MTTWNVQIQFDADTEDDARATLATWQLSDGATVLQIMGAQSLIDQPVSIGAGRTIPLDGAPKAAPTG